MSSSELSKQITKETTKFRNANAVAEMVNGRWVRLGTIRAVSPTQEVTSGCRVPPRPLFATRTTRVASRLLPTRPLSRPPETVNHPHGEPGADLQNAAACRDRLATVCDSYVRNRRHRVLNGCDLVIEMPDWCIHEIYWKSEESLRTAEMSPIHAHDLL